MSRIENRFVELRARKRKALIPYITAGDPALSTSLSLMHVMVDAGADILELGVPFSDPMADGPVIQAGYERALKHHVSLAHVLALVAEFRKMDTTTPVVLMGYLNPIEIMGYQRFAHEAAEAGVDGVLTVDLPPEEAHELIAALQPVQLDPIFLIAPTSRARRIALVSKVASGFVYYVSLKGVTGAHSLDVTSVADKLAEIRQHTALPIGVGFGIKDAATAARIARIADAVVVGSALVRCIELNVEQEARMQSDIAGLLNAMREAMDESR